MQLAKIPKPPSLFPHMMKKMAEDGKFNKFMAMLNQFLVNVPLVEVLKQMPGNAKFMKDLVIKKRTVSYKLNNNLHHCSLTSMKSLFQKKYDLRKFTI